VTFD
jgi:hypothetical protein